MRVHLYLHLPLLSALIISVTGCDSNFDEKWTLKGYRVLGVEAEAPEVGPDDVIRLTLHDFDADKAPAAPAYTWSVCLHSFGSVVDFECAAPELEIPLNAAGPVATLDLGPSGLNLRAVYEASGPLPLPDGSQATLEEGLTLWFFIDSGPPDGRQVHTIKRVLVREAAGPVNTNPGVEAFTLNDIDGDITAAAGADVKLNVRTTPGAEEPMIGVDGEPTTEELLYAFYTTDGELDASAGYAEHTESTLTLPKTPGVVTLFVAVRDGRGGFALRSHKVQVE